MATLRKIRRDSKHRLLRAGESIRADGKYQFKYYVGDKAKFVYSWRLEPTDKLPAGKKATPSLRELEKQIGRDIESQLDPQKLNLTVVEITEPWPRTPRSSCSTSRPRSSTCRTVTNSARCCDGWHTTTASASSSRRTNWTSPFRSATRSP